MTVNLFGKNVRLVDLTHSLHSGVPSWSGSCGFKAHVEFDYDQGCRVLSYESIAGIGTHMDAPNHFVPKSVDISAISIENFIVPICILQLSKKANPNFMVSIEDVRAYEKEYGLIPNNAFVAANTGWHKRWDKPSEYRNCDDSGLMHFPRFAPSTVEFLLERNISGIGSCGSPRVKHFFTSKYRKCNF